ncbi:tail fiber domain-containing protein [Psychromonas aquimarina]|uniref:tail fiber domain-containing protein n=1 Tax=Psychromonas aquimarina TaxID=444919 RepID=UPI00040B7B50|nr:tail fiber domain-containing protein [Psychromonas aquimarina]
MNTVITKLVLISGVCLSSLAAADQKIQDDLVVVGSECIGVDCVSGENFNFDTVRLKENNLRIKFQDTSSSSSFPRNDWELTANDSANGGLNRFSITDVDAGRTPFTVLAGAPDHSLYISSSGRLGIGTSAPLVEAHILAGNTPSVRLDQNNTQGWGAYTWDVGANETNFFIRDYSNNSRMPFRIRAAAPNNSLFIDADGDIGFETSTPDGLLDVAHPMDANNHAFLISPAGDVGINIDNGYVPTALFDVQNSGQSVFSVKSDGTVAAKAGLVAQGDICTNESGSLKCLSTAGGSSSTPAWSPWTIENNGSGNLEFTSGTGVLALTVTKDGEIQAKSGVCGKGGKACHFASSRALKNIEEIVDTKEVLDKLSTLEISRWTYKSDNDPSIVHMGVMSEDFHSVFGLDGDTSDKIAIVDAVGVSMASIQALNNKLLEKDIEITKINNELDSLKSELQAIKALLLQN